MTTVYINGKFIGQRVTGVQRVASRLVQALDARLSEAGSDADTRWVLLCPPEGEPPQLQRIEVHRIGTVAAGLHFWEQVFLPLASRRGVLLSLAGSAPALKAKQVCTFHDAAIFDQPQAYSRRFLLWYRFLFKWLSRRARLVITVSDFSRSRLMTHLGVAPDRIAVVRSGCEHLDAVVPDPNILKKFGLKPERYFMVVGSANPTKNHAGVIRAFRALQIDPEVRLVIVGGGPEAVFADAGPASEGEAIIRTGRANDAQLKALYQHAAALVFPSFYEGYGLPPLEAMACGCPVVAASAASLPEVCGDAAAYVDPHSIEQISAVMQALLDDSLLRDEFRRKGAAHATRLTWPVAASSLLASLSRAGLTGAAPE